MNAVTHPAGRVRGASPLDVARVRLDFPILARLVNGQPLAYLDNAASSQHPQSVIDAVSRYYEHSHANVHRGVHALSQEATDLFEGARRRVQHFINARSPREIVFVRGTTEAINLVAQSWGRPALRQGDEILISHLEHHANIVPWQLLCEQTGARLRVIPMTRAGELDFDAYRGPAVRPHSPACAGSRLERARHDRARASASSPRHGGVASRSLLDGAQAVPHMKVDVQALDCDFYCFSSHKMCGPTGIGVLYGREALLNAMPPWQGGGDMILAVTFRDARSTTRCRTSSRRARRISRARSAWRSAVDYLETLGTRPDRSRRA